MEKPVVLGLFPGHDDVHVIAASQAVVRHRQETVGVRREVGPNDGSFLVDDVIDETGVLVGEAVVVLAPDVTRQQVVQRGDGAAATAPLALTLSHLACWLNMESTMWMKAS